MDKALLSNFKSLDDAAFGALAAAIGYKSAACYKLEGHDLTLQLGTNESEGDAWPASIDIRSSNYNAVDLPLGWWRGQKSRQFPAGAMIYFPDQEQATLKIVLVVVPFMRKRVNVGDLDGSLEAVGRRISFWLNDALFRHFIDDAVLEEHGNILSKDILSFLDHNLRTPLTMIDGYANIIASEDQGASESCRIIREQVDNAIGALEKVSLMLGPSSTLSGDSESLDIGQLTQGLVQRVRTNATSGREVDVRFLCQESSGELIVAGVRNLLSMALLEVLQNATKYGANGQVTVSVYRSGQQVIVDVADTGEGVPSGAEELIFMKFYRAPSQRDGTALGLGLFIAKRIVEHHSGQLTYIRGGHKGGLFRFLLPYLEQFEEGVAS